VLPTSMPGFRSYHRKVCPDLFDLCSLCHLLFCWLYRIALLASNSSGLLLFETWTTTGLVVSRTMWLFGRSYTTSGDHTHCSLCSAIPAKIRCVHSADTRELATKAQCHTTDGSHSCGTASIYALPMGNFWQSVAF